MGVLIIVARMPFALPLMLERLVWSEPLSSVSLMDELLPVLRQGSGKCRSGNISDRRFEGSHPAERAALRTEYSQARQ